MNVLIEIRKYALDPAIKPYFVSIDAYNNNAVSDDSIQNNPKAAAVLGDAILSYMCISAAYNAMMGATGESLTNYRKAHTSNARLACIYDLADIGSYGPRVYSARQKASVVEQLIGLVHSLVPNRVKSLELAAAIAVYEPEAVLPVSFSANNPVTAVLDYSPATMIE